MKNVKEILLDNTKFLTIIFSVLFLILLTIVTGYFIYLYYPKISTIIYKDQNQSPIIRSLLLDSGKTLTRKEYIHYLKSISQVAIHSDLITLKNCTLTPKITKANKSSPITLQNLDHKATYVTIGYHTQLRIEPSSTITVPLTFVTHTPSVLGIGCMGSVGASGILYIP